jgi:hypothetical protein
MNELFDERLLSLHPWVREAIYEENRDKPLTLNWAPAEPDAYDRLGLRRLTANAMRARDQIIAEALVAGPDQYISYSRRREFYARNERYYRQTYTYRAIIPAVDQLAAEGLLDHQKMPQGHRGYQSRFRASVALLKELEKVKVVYEPLETIILRDRDGYLVDYRDNRDTRRMRKRLEALNEGLVTQEIAVKDRVIREGDRLDNGGRARAQLHRVFNRSSLDLGGRFYGAHWQNIPSVGGRDGIKIDGKATVEIDYAAIHVRLLYQEAGKQLVGDPYDVAGWPRKQVKPALLIAINAPTPIGAIRALADALKNFPDVGNRFETAKALIEAVRAKHPDIAHAFGSDAGARLMRKDADLAERVMIEMLTATGIVPLSVHDSFIVPTNQAAKLEEVMERQISQKGPNFGDNNSIGIQKASPKTVPQYGIDLGPPEVRSGMEGEDSEALWAELPLELRMLALALA